MLNKIFIFILGLCLGYLFSIAWVKVIKKISQEKVLRTNYHFHHSLFFFPLAIVSLLTGRLYSLFFISMGIGIIAEDIWHHKKLIFVNKE